MQPKDHRVQESYICRIVNRDSVPPARAPAPANMAPSNVSNFAPGALPVCRYLGTRLSQCIPASTVPDCDNDVRDGIRQLALLLSQCAGFY